MSVPPPPLPKSSIAFMLRIRILFPPLQLFAVPNRTKKCIVIYFLPFNHLHFCSSYKEPYQNEASDGQLSYTMNKLHKVSLEDIS